MAKAIWLISEQGQNKAPPLEFGSSQSMHHQHEKPLSSGFVDCSDPWIDNRGDLSLSSLKKQKTTWSTNHLTSGSQRFPKKHLRRTQNHPSSNNPKRRRISPQNHLGKVSDHLRGRRMSPPNHQGRTSNHPRKRSISSFE